MSAAEELLLYNVAQAYRILCETVINMHLAEDDEVRQASHELALQCLLPIEAMRVLVKYLYYDTVLSYDSWLKQSDSRAEAEAVRAKTARVITLLLAEHLAANEVRGDTGEMRGRCGGDAGEMWGRCGGDTREVWGRCRGDAGEM